VFRSLCQHRVHGWLWGVEVPHPIWCSTMTSWFIKPIWLVVEPPTPLKNHGVSSSVGMMAFPTEWKVIKKCSKPLGIISNIATINHRIHLGYTNLSIICQINQLYINPQFCYPRISIFPRLSRTTTQDAAKTTSAKAKTLSRHADGSWRWNSAHRDHQATTSPATAAEVSEKMEVSEMKVSEMVN
jgi:hypothetical protein